MTEIKEVALTESRTLRDQYAGRTDVLDKVKALSLLPDDMHATTEGVAAYYEVSPKTIESLVFDNREELEGNGYAVISGERLASFKKVCGISSRARSLALFSRRAVLNVGQLLRDSEVARAVRTHLLDAEAEQAAPAHPLPRTFSEALRELADAVEQRDAAEQRITELQPAADAWEKLADAKGDYSVREAAQILSRDPLITTGQNRLFAYLRHIGWIDKTGTPYQTQVDLGRILPLATSYSHPRTGDRMTSSQVRVTPKGLKELRVRLAGQQQLVVIEGGA